QDGRGPPLRDGGLEPPGARRQRRDLGPHLLGGPQPAAPVLERAQLRASPGRADAGRRRRDHLRVRQLGRPGFRRPRPVPDHEEDRHRRGEPHHDDRRAAGGRGGADPPRARAHSGGATGADPGLRVRPRGHQPADRLLQVRFAGPGGEPRAPRAGAPRGAGARRGSPPRLRFRAAAGRSVTRPAAAPSRNGGAIRGSLRVGRAAMARQRCIPARRGPVRRFGAGRPLPAVALLLALALLAGCGRAAAPAPAAGGAASAPSQAAAPPASAPQPQKVAVRLDWVPWAVQAPLHLAVDRGWFAERGLDVELQDGNGSVVAVQTVGAGKFDLGYASLATMAMGRAEGLPVRAVAGFVRKGDLGMLFPEGAPIRSPKDVEGLSIIYTPGAFEAPFLDAFFRSGGTSRDRVNLITVDAAAKYQTYAAGRGDAVFGPVPY